MTRILLSCLVATGVLLPIAKAWAIDMYTATEVRDGYFIEADSDERESRSSLIGYGLEGDFSEGEALATADPAVRMPGSRTDLSKVEVPARVFALASSVIDMAQSREDCGAGKCWGGYNPWGSIQASAYANASYDMTFILAPDAPAEAYSTPIPLTFWAMWSVNGSGQMGGGYAGLTVANLFSFSASANSDGTMETSFTGTGDEGLDDAARNALMNSGGQMQWEDLRGSQIQPFTYSIHPNSSWTILAAVNAGASVSASQYNNWNAEVSSASAFMDPVIRVDPSYAYLEYLEIEWSEGLYVDLDELSNPYAGTPYESIGVALLNAPYNDGAFVDEPSPSILLLAGLGLAGLVMRRKAVASYP